MKKNIFLFSTFSFSLLIYSATLLGMEKLEKTLNSELEKQVDKQFDSQSSTPDTNGGWFSWWTAGNSTQEQQPTTNLSASTEITDLTKTVLLQYKDIEVPAPSGIGLFQSGKKLLIGEEPYIRGIIQNNEYYTNGSHKRTFGRVLAQLIISKDEDNTPRITNFINDCRQHKQKPVSPENSDCQLVYSFLSIKGKNEKNNLKNSLGKNEIETINSINALIAATQNHVKEQIKKSKDILAAYNRAQDAVTQLHGEKIKEIEQAKRRLLVLNKKFDLLPNNSLPQDLEQDPEQIKTYYTDNIIVAEIGKDESLHRTDEDIEDRLAGIEQIGMRLDAILPIEYTKSERK